MFVLAEEKTSSLNAYEKPKPEPHPQEEEHYPKYIPKMSLGGIKQPPPPPVQNTPEQEEKEVQQPRERKFQPQPKPQPIPVQNIEKEEQNPVIPQTDGIPVFNPKKLSNEEEWNPDE